jgi:hypothetical protein
MKQLERMIEKNGTSKNQIKHFHDLTIQMLIFASALDNNEISDKPIESCKRFMKIKTVALAKQELKNQFESWVLNEVSFSKGYTANLYLGVPFLASSDTPSIHSPFSFSKVEPIQAAVHKNWQLTLQLILTQGQGIMMVAEIKALNKQEVHGPINFPKMHEQLLMLMTKNDITVDKFSIESQIL